ncbi:hypothetical protein INT44_008879, partial [Umbelopsis vinacea]
MHFTRSLAVLASFALANAIPVPQDDGTTTSSGSSPSNAIKLVSESDFCLFLPPQPGLEVATNEDNGIPFCSNGPTDVSGAKPFPDGFITVAHYQQNGTYQQVTGYMNPSTYQLNSTDQGGQYDNHGNGKPVGASCQGYNYFVSIIEPADNRFCIRCCQDVEDCNTGRSGYGCLRVVPGDYTQADGSQPSDAAAASAPTDTDSGAQPTDTTTPPADPTTDDSDATTDGSDATTDGSDTTADDTDNDHSDAGLTNEWAENDVLTPGVDDTGANPSTDTTGDDTGANPSTDTTGDDTGANPSTDTTGDDTSSNPATTDNGTNSTNPVSGIVSSEFPAEVTSLQALLANGTSVQDIQQNFQQFVQGIQAKYPNAAQPLQQLAGLTSGFTTTEEWQNFVQTLQTKIANASNGGSGSDADISSLPPTPSSSLPVSDASGGVPTDAPSSAPSSDAPLPTDTTDGETHDNVWIAEDDVTGGDLNDSSVPPSDAPTASLPTSDPSNSLVASATDSAAPSATPSEGSSQPLTAEQLDQELDTRFTSLEQKIMDELRAFLGNNTSSTEHNDHNNQAA